VGCIHHWLKLTGREDRTNKQVKQGAPGEKNAHGGGWVLFLRFLVFFLTIVLGVFELPMRRNVQTRNKKAITGKATWNLPHFFVKHFRHSTWT
jgi:hypothetical protein